MEENAGVVAEPQAQSPSADDSNLSQEAPVAEGKQNTVPESIPYSRFKEVNDTKAQLEQKVKDYEAQVAEYQKQIRSENQPKRMGNSRNVDGLPDDVAEILAELESPKLKDNYSDLNEFYSDTSKNIINEVLTVLDARNKKQQQTQEQISADINKAKEIVGDGWQGFEQWATKFIERTNYQGSIEALTEFYPGKQEKQEEADTADKVSTGKSKPKVGQKSSLDQLRSKSFREILRGN